MVCFPRKQALWPVHPTVMSHVPRRLQRAPSTHPAHAPAACECRRPYLSGSSTHDTSGASCSLHALTSSCPPALLTQCMHACACTVGLGDQCQAGAVHARTRAAAAPHAPCSCTGRVSARFKKHIPAEPCQAQQQLLQNVLVGYRHDSAAVSNRCVS